MPLPIQKEDDAEKEPQQNNASSLIQQKMLESRSIVISGEINQALTEKVVSQLLLLQGIGNVILPTNGGHAVKRVKSLTR